MATSGGEHAPSKSLPAWKKLGLKLKSSSNTDNSAESSSKRKQYPSEDSYPTKRLKAESAASKNNSGTDPRTPIVLHKKSVSFTPETKVDDGDSSKKLFNDWIAERKRQDPTFDFKNTNTGKVSDDVEITQVEQRAGLAQGEVLRKVKRAKIPKAERKSKDKHSDREVTNADQISLPISTRPFLQYLQQYSKSRETWKFNKNHQNHLLKHAFDLSIIPSDYIHLLYAYIRGLQGGVRIRLRDTALAAKVQDIEAGPSGFAADMANKDQRQADYEAAIKEYIATMSAAEVDQEELGYEEGVLLGLSDKAMWKRAARRMRTERILKELEATGTSLTDEKVHVDVAPTVDGQPKKVARKRKQRTIVDDSSSSDSSSSDSSDSSSDDSSDSETEAGDKSNSSNSSSGASSSSTDSESGSDSSSQSSGTSSSDDSDSE